MFGRGNDNKHWNKRKSDFGAYFDTNVCVHSVYHSNRRVAVASMNMSVFKTRFLMKPHITLFFCGCATSILLNSLALTLRAPGTLTHHPFFVISSLY